MKYISTRGRAETLSFDEVVLTGLARDGGLYVPEAWPKFTKDDIRALSGLDYADLATRVMMPYIGDSIPEADVADMVRDTYGSFDHRAVAPLKQMGHNLWMMELFHGPTLAFKDYALQFLGRLFDYLLTKKGERITVVGATSGDTGSAAIEACKDRSSIDCFILYPEGRVSEVQRRQMTTVKADNVHCIAVKGTFDDCQNMVKDLFNNHTFRDDMNLSAVNSINWARVMAQIVYYFWAGEHLGAMDRTLSFSVPTGNFGNAFAAYAAKQMGFPIGHIVIGSNENDILTRFFETGAIVPGDVVATTSPSMDIQISSNFERVLFELYGRDSAAVVDLMDTFADIGTYKVDDDVWKKACEQFSGVRYTNGEVGDIIDEIHSVTGELLDTHSAIGIAGAEGRRRTHDTPMVSLATAHPSKFPDAVKAATGVHPHLPDRLADLHDRDEKFTVMENDIGAVEAYIRTHGGK